jgi:hypothetical protein
MSPDSPLPEGSSPPVSSSLAPSVTVKKEPVTPPQCPITPGSSGSKERPIPLDFSPSVSPTIPSCSSSVPLDICQTSPLRQPPPRDQTPQQFGHCELADLHPSANDPALSTVQQCADSHPPPQPMQASEVPTTVSAAPQTLSHRHRYRSVLAPPQPPATTRRAAAKLALMEEEPMVPKSSKVHDQ